MKRKQVENLLKPYDEWMLGLKWLVYSDAKSFVQKDTGPFNILIYYTGAPVDSALFKENHIRVGQLITSM